MEEQFSQRKPKQMLNGRQIFFMMVQHFKTNEAADGIHDFEMILSVELRGDNLDDFQRVWDMVMLRTSEKNRLPEDQLEMLYRKQVKKSNQFYQDWSRYNYDVMHNKQPRSYKVLHKMVAGLAGRKLNAPCTTSATTAIARVTPPALLTNLRARAGPADGCTAHACAGTPIPFS